MINLTLRRRLAAGLTGLVLLIAHAPAWTAVYALPPDGDDVIGAPTTTQARASDTLVNLGREYNMGYREMRLANPDVDPWLPGEGTTIRLPSQHILPDAPREGLVLNLAEMRLYYYPPKDSEYAGKVITYPLGVGREGWATPLGTTRIVRTRANPTWTPPESIKAEHAEAGDPLPDVVPAGPDNPLGEYALYLALPSYLLHGTNKPGGIGLRVSHGCIRLYPEDIAALYSMVDAGTPVRIINQPYKVGWHDGDLYLEAHPPDGDGFDNVEAYTPLVEQIIAATRERPKFPVDWDKAQAMAKTANGVPRIIGHGADAKSRPQAAGKPEPAYHAS